MAERTDLVLLVFGAASLVGLWVVGALIDRHARALTLLSTAFFGLATLIFGLRGGDPAAIYAAAAIWGLAYGGVPTLFQTALAKASGNAADIAQAMLVTVWNVAIAGGGIVGGLLLDSLGIGAFAPALLGLLVPTLVVIALSRQHGFPRARP